MWKARSIYNHITGHYKWISVIPSQYYSQQTTLRLVEGRRYEIAHGKNDDSD